MNYFEMIFFMFGITKMEISESWEISYVKTNYYHPVVSLLFLILIAGVCITIGAISLKRRDISG